MNDGFRLLQSRKIRNGSVSQQQEIEGGGNGEKQIHACMAFLNEQPCPKWAITNICMNQETGLFATSGGEGGGTLFLFYTKVGCFPHTTRASHASRSPSRDG